MNIFVVDSDPVTSAKQLPDRHVVKMSLEACQMLSIIYSKWYFNWGTLSKKDGSVYETSKGSFRNHPCTQWAAEKIQNMAWLITHGIALCDEYEFRYNKIHSCKRTLLEAKEVFQLRTDENILIHSKVEEFTRAMPDLYKLDKTISTQTAYRLYVASKPWVKDNYLRKPERKPEWVL